MASSDNIWLATRQTLNRSRFNLAAQHRALTIVQLKFGLTRVTRLRTLIGHQKALDACDVCVKLKTKHKLNKEAMHDGGDDGEIVRSSSNLHRIL